MYVYIYTGLIKKGSSGMFFACEIWFVADVSSVTSSPSSEHDRANSHSFDRYSKLK